MQSFWKSGIYPYRETKQEKTMQQLKNNQKMKRLFCAASVFALVLGLNAQNTLLFTEVCVANIDQTIDYSNNYGGCEDVLPDQQHYMPGRTRSG